MGYVDWGLVSCLPLYGQPSTSLPCLGSGQEHGFFPRETCHWPWGLVLPMPIWMFLVAPWNNGVWARSLTPSPVFSLLDSSLHPQFQVQVEWAQALPSVYHVFPPPWNRKLRSLVVTVWSLSFHSLSKTNKQTNKQTACAFSSLGSWHVEKFW